MELGVQQLDGASVIAVKGSIDALTAGEVLDFISGQMGGGHNRLVVDLSGVEFMSSAGLRALLMTLKESRQQGGDLRLAGAQPGVAKILRLAGFPNILQVFSTVDQAVTSFGS